MEERDIVIIGGGPAGMSAAIFPQMDGWSTLILEANVVGGQITYAGTVGNYPGYLPGDGAVLMKNLYQQVTSAPPAGIGAELRKERVWGIDAGNKIVKTEVDGYKAKTIILATGSTMKRLGVPGEDTFHGRGVSDSAVRDCKQFAGKKVMVVGGANTTIKSVLAAKSQTPDVILVHHRDQLRAYRRLVEKLKRDGVEIWYNTEVKEIMGGDRVEKVRILNNKTDKESEVAVDWVVVCVGTEPNTELARAAGLRMSEEYIKVNEHMMTSSRVIFACGEITGCDRHLITCAAQGTTAGMAASSYLALSKVKQGEMFEGAIAGKYAFEYKDMIDRLPLPWLGIRL